MATNKGDSKYLWVKKTNGDITKEIAKLLTKELCIDDACLDTKIIDELVGDRKGDIINREDFTALKKGMLIEIPFDSRFETYQNLIEQAIISSGKSNKYQLLSHDTTLEELYKEAPQ